MYACADAMQVLELRQVIGDLLNSLIEENGTHELMVAKVTVISYDAIPLFGAGGLFSFTTVAC